MLSLLLLSLAPAISTAQTPRFIFSFGDSYSSTGYVITGAQPSTNNPTGNPAYPGVTTSGGENWIDILTKDLSPTGTLNYNYAAYGATVNGIIAPESPPTILTFDEQVGKCTLNGCAVGNLLNPAPWNAGNSVFISWFGLNDIQRTAASNFDNDLDDYASRLQDLYNIGARRFVAVLVPPAARTPLYAVDDPQAAPALAADVTSWNTKLQQRLNTFQSSHAGSTVMAYDPTNTFNMILDDPQAYGAPNNTCSNSNGVSCLWWDHFHPGQAIHHAIASDMHTVLSNEKFYA